MNSVSSVASTNCGIALYGDVTNKCKIELIRQHFSRQNKNVINIATRMNYKAFTISLYTVFVESASIRAVATPRSWASIKISRDVYGLCTVWENGSCPPQKCTPTPLNLGGGGTCIGWLSHCRLFRTTTTRTSSAGAYAQIGVHLQMNANLCKFEQICARRMGETEICAVLKVLQPFEAGGQEISLTRMQRRRNASLHL